jgi:hypothetical protein
MPSFPADRNATTELAGTGAALNTIAGAGANAYAQYSPQYTSNNLANMNSALRGNFDQVAYDRANPGVLQDFQRQQGAGGLQGWQFSDFAAANAGLSSGDASLNKYYTGSLGANLRTAYDAANPQQNAANNRLAADRDQLNGQTIPGVQTNTAQFTGSQGRPDIAGQYSQGLPGVQTNTAQFQGSQGIAGVGTAAAQFTGAQGQGAQAYNAQFNPSQARATDARYTGAQGGPMAGALQSDALRNLGQVSGLQGQLQNQAGALLATGGRLTQGETMDAQQSARAAYSDRGMGRSNAAIGAEILGTDQAQRARLMQNAQFAQGVDASGQQQLAQGRSYAQGVQAQNQSLSQFNSGQQNQNSQFNAGQRTGISQFNTGQANTIGSNLSQFNAGQNQQNSQFNSSLGADLSKFNAQGQNAMNQSAAERADANARFNYQGQMQNQQFNATGMNAMNQDAASRADANARFNLSNLTQNNQFNAGQANDLARFNYSGANQNNQFNATGMNAMNQDAAARGDANARFNYQGQLQQGNDQFNRSQAVAGQYGTQAINPGTYAAQLAQGTPDYTGQTLNFMSDLNNTNYNAAASRYNSAANNSAAIKAATISTIGRLFGGSGPG